MIDLLIDGDEMCTDYPGCSGDKIAPIQQKIHNETQDFDWDSTGEVLVDSDDGADVGDEADGC